MAVTQCEKVAPWSARTPGRQQVLRGSGGLVLQCGDGCSVALMPSAARKEYNKLQSLAEAAARPVNSKASSLIHGPRQPPPLPRPAGDANSRSRVVGSPPPHSLPTPVTSGRRIDSATPSTATAPREGRRARVRRADAARKRHEAAVLRYLRDVDDWEERREEARGLAASAVEAGGWSGAFADCVYESIAGAAGRRPKPPPQWREPLPAHRHPCFDQEGGWPYPPEVPAEWCSETGRWVPVGTTFVFGYVRVKLKFYEDDYTRKLRDDRPVNLVLRVGSADGRALWESIGADDPCGREEPTPTAPAPARQEQWAPCENDEYVDWAVCDDDDADAWEGADAYGAYDM